MKTKKVLIVEDNTSDKESIMAFLRRSFDCEITTTESLPVARSLLLGNTVFDIIVLDFIILGFQKGGYGKDLLPVINQGLSKKAVVMRFSKNPTSIEEAKKSGMLVFNSTILEGDHHFDENYNVV